jgi:ComF family protein
MIKYFSGLGLVLKNYYDGLGHLIFTNVCLHCNNELVHSENYLCFTCWEQLESTYFEKEQQANKVERIFLGRIQVKHACSVYFYAKGSVSQSLIRALKYDFKAPLGVYLGELMAQKMEGHPLSKCDFLLPVPIHPRKKFARGYNQSELLARGLSKCWGTPILKQLVRKKGYTKSQTKLDRFGRWDNVQDIFRSTELLQSRSHVLIVDDVITTGATLEALVRAIQFVNPEIQISLLSFAFTK